MQKKFTGPAWRAAQEALRQALARPGHPKVWNKESQEMVRPRDLLLSCKRTEFFHLLNGRGIVQWVQPIPTHAKPIWQPGWLQTKAGCVPIGEEWGKPTECKTFTGSIKSLFDQIPV